MINEIIDNKDSFEEQCRKFGELLELGKPVTAEVLISAIHDENYARNLVANKRTPSVLLRLLRNPPNVNSDHKPEHHFTNAELIKSGAIALIKWSKSGFTKVDEKTLEIRENACLACPNLADPEKLLQILAPTKKITNRVGERTGKHVCDLCGCHVSKKMRLVSEECPDKHPSKEGYTRWNEKKYFTENNNTEE